MTPRAEKTLEQLREESGNLSSGRGNFLCSDYLVAQEGIQITSIFGHLINDRLDRKHEAAMEIYHRNGQNWNQTFYTLLFRYIGARVHQELYTEVASRVEYKIILKENRSLTRIEALLFGCSGLLETCRPDDYIRELRREFDYLRVKYNLVPLEASAWETSYPIRPSNLPKLRFAQLATFLLQRDFVFDRMLECRTRDQVHALFSAEAASYWSGKNDSPKRVGWLKTDLYGINVVVVLQYIYGAALGKDNLRERAGDLLRAIPPEENVYIKQWRARGVVSHSAYDTQALLQLSTEYCMQKRCGECPVGRQIIAKIEAQEVQF